jgi:hypothetical protein
MLYEFRLLDAGGKVSATQKRECQTVQDAIKLSAAFMAEYHIVEIWLDGQAIVRAPLH